MGEPSKNMQEEIRRGVVYLKIVNKKIEDIKPYEKNPRKNDDAVEYVANSIKEFGFKVPIVIDKQNVIVAGHTRYKASKQLGLKEVPCIVADDLTDEQIKAYRLADNKVSEHSEWDFELLEEELNDIFNINMSEYGFEMSLEEEEKEIVEVDVPEMVEETRTKPGYIYQLGKHRLMCGDSTKAENLKELLDENIIDLIMTDPPYNVNYGSINETGYGKERHNSRPIENDDMSEEDFYQFLYSVFSSAIEHVKPGGAFYVWYASKSVVNFQKSLEDAGFLVKQEIVWNKNSFTLGRQDYQWKHEPCLYGWKEGAGHYFTKDRTQTTVIEDKIDLDKMKKEDMRKLLEEFINNQVPTSVVDENKPTVNDLHPTMKPIRLIAKLVKNSSRENENVLDLFGGSGSTLMACEQLNRKCFMMEYDPHYIDVIVKRWEEFTGEKAILIKGE